jgi:hypothetical protein
MTADEPAIHQKDEDATERSGTGGEFGTEPRRASLRERPTDEHGDPHLSEKRDG